MWSRIRAGVPWGRNPGSRLIVDRQMRLGNFEATDVGYPVDLCKEEVAREHIFGLSGEGLAFLDVGARDGRLEYLLGVRGNLAFDHEVYARNRRRFDAKFVYYGLDLEPEDTPNVIRCDICSDEPGLDEYREFFDVVYSNNVFEHLRRPWVAAANILGMVRPGGLAVTITEFALRYHAVPEDYFRYSHTGLTALFADQGDVEELVSGYDILGRRNDWQGAGTHNDICPVDEFGAWRENWFVVNVLRKRRS